MTGAGAVVTGRPAGFRGTLRDDELARAVYSESAGIARVQPLAVAVPEDADDVSTLVEWAHETRTPLVPRGSGSSMAGGAVGPGVIVDLSRLNVVRPVDATRRQVVVGPGATRGAVNQAAAAHRLRLPVDPSSGKYCTLGGMASTNAAGARSLRFGATRAWVTALDCVFDDGARATLRRGDEMTAHAHIPAVTRFAHQAMPLVFTAAMAEPVAELRHPGVRKESSGYALSEFARSGHLVDLVVGSEGTLALIVGLELTLAPAAGGTSSLLAAFSSLEQAVEGATRARDAGASACELLDRTFLEVAAKGSGSVTVPERTEAALLVELEGDNPAAAAALSQTLAVAMREAGASEVRLALDTLSEETLWELRHAASPILAQLDPSLRSMQFIEDAAVPVGSLPEYVRGVRAALARYDVRGIIFGHAGDAHVHVNPLVDVRRPAWRAEVEAILDEVTSLVARLGGTVAGEHGDGRLRTPLLDRVWAADATLLFAVVKHAFDPLNIFNPGVKVPLDGQHALGAIKYDPALPPLPAPARRVLDRVERERAYDHLRLSLLDVLPDAAG